ncbi:MAG: efflux RND transporter permease subunit, partial [Planctomycetota bacterium]
QGTESTGLVPISAVTKRSLQPQLSGIPHINRRRLNEVSAFLQAGVLPSDALADFQQRLADSDIQLPVGYSIEYGGETSKRNEAVGNLFASVAVLVVMMVATLVLSFGSFRLAAIIGIVAMLSVGLGVGALWCSGYPFGFMAIIGTMGLIGVAINDSIVVLAAIQSRAKTGDVTDDGLVKTVVESTRHVIATTATTMAGFAPLYFFSGGDFWPPLAIAIGGGVAGATLLALVFVPAAYRLVVRRSEFAV